MNKVIFINAPFLSNIERFDSQVVICNFLYFPSVLNNNLIQPLEYPTFLIHQDIN